MANEAIDLIITKKAREELIETRNEVVKLDAEFIKLANDISAFQGKGNPFPKLPKEYEEQLKRSSEWTAQLNANNKEAERLAKALSVQKARLAKLETENAKALTKERLETQLLNKALKDEAVLSSKLVGEYRKLTVKRNQAAKAIKDEIALNGQNSKQLARLRAEFSKLDKRYVAANRATRDFRDNVGNYKSALGGATGALRSFVGVFGIYSGIQIAREIYSQIKAIDAMEKALKQVTGTTEAYNQAQFFLAQTADESGANIIGLTSAYTKFLASAKTTNLTLDETQNIFRQVSKAAGVLGLSTDDTNGAFRALEQILSKGKVQAEEIRGQLGERLPGAFQILAKSMGLTTAELDKQLKLGNVLSEEVLPGFAKQLEETYSLDKVQRVETLAAAQNRLGNAWTAFLKAVEGGEGTITKVLGGMLEFITMSVKGFERLFKSVEQVNNEFNDKTRAENYRKEMEAMQGAASDLGQSLKQIASRNFFDYTKSVEAANESILKLKSSQIELTDLLKNSGSQDEFGKIQEDLDRVNKLLEEEEVNLAIKQGRLDAVNDVLRKNTDETKKNNKEVDESSKKNKVRNKELKVTAELYGSLNDEAEKAAKGAERIREILNGTVAKKRIGVDVEAGGFTQSDIFDETKIAFGADAIEAPDTDEIAAALKKVTAIAIASSSEIKNSFGKTAQEMEDIFSGTFSTFEQFYGLDLTAFKDLLSGKEASLDSYSSFAKSLSNSILEGKLIAYEKEQDANQKRLDAILSDETVSDRRKEQAKREFDKREAEINNKKAKANKDAALTQIAIDTATAIVKALPNFALAAAVAAFGAAQSIIVANTQLPEFAEGTLNAPQGKAITDELGPELRLSKTGKIKSWGSKRPRIQKLDKGDKIIPADITRDIYKEAIASNNEKRQNNIDMAIMRAVSIPSIDLKAIGKEVGKQMEKYTNQPHIWRGSVNVNQPKKSRYHSV